MADLGDFTAAVREKSRAEGALDTFTFFGERFAFAPALSAFPLMKLAAAAESGLDSAQMAGLAAMYAFIKSILVAEPVMRDGVVVAQGYPEFERVCMEHMVDDEDLQKLVGELVQAMTGKVSTPQSDSPTSEPQTSAVSKRASSQEAWDQRMRAAGMVPVEEAALAASSG